MSKWEKNPQSNPFQQVRLREVGSKKSSKTNAPINSTKHSKRKESGCLSCVSSCIRSLIAIILTILLCFVMFKLYTFVKNSDKGDIQDL